MRRLALSNSNVGEIGTFKDVLFDLLTGNPDDQAPSHQEEELIEPTLSEALATVKLKNVEKKKVKGQAFTKRPSLKDNSTKKTPRVCRTPMSFPVIMELITLGKQKVKVPANIVESTLSKRMH